jgi:arsenite methyltransferase
MTKDDLECQYDWNNPELVSAHDALSLWSAEIGGLLLREVPLRSEARLLDVGCGTGFPLIELSQRLGPTCRAVGIDASPASCERARQKIRAYGIANIEVVHGDAAAMPFDSERFNLIVSHLGINNFADAPKAIGECGRVAQAGAVIALTSNLQGHMQGFYDAFEITLKELNPGNWRDRLQSDIRHRATVESMRELLSGGGFVVKRVVKSAIVMRYLDGSSLLKHFFIRPAFLSGWLGVVDADQRLDVFDRLEQNLNELAARHGELRLEVPVAYVEAVKG